MIEESGVSGIDKVLSRLGTAVREKGIIHLAKSTVREAYTQTKDRMAYVYHSHLKSESAFTFRGKMLPYFYHMYGRTWQNERCVEVPIIWDIARNSEGKKVLEVGHVLRHYYPLDHDIVDKYEIADGVVNEDIIDYHPEKKYDLIFSISTLEHVGLYEDPEKPGKVLQAFANLRRLLAPKGSLIVTLPIGFNPALDSYLDSAEIKFTEKWCMNRIAVDRWIEATWAEVRTAKYDFPYPNANAIVIGTIQA